MQARDYGEEGHILSELAHILSRENLDRIFGQISRAVDASCAVRTLAFIPENRSIGAAWT